MTANTALLDTMSGERFIRIRINNLIPLERGKRFELVNYDRWATVDGSLGLT